jgi:alcohol dehydrogenase (cytochrome c)
MIIDKAPCSLNFALMYFTLLIMISVIMAIAAADRISSIEQTCENEKPLSLFQNKTSLAEIMSSFSERYLCSITNLAFALSAKDAKAGEASSITNLGTEGENKDNWITANHDVFGSRSSSQTVIDRENIDKLQVKWIFLDRHRIENPPLVVGSKLYVEDNVGDIFALDAVSGRNLWKTSTGGWGLMHGMTYDRGLLFAPTGHNATVIAINASSGKIIWQSVALGNGDLDYSIGTPPLLWKDYLIVGSANSGLPKSINYKGVLGNVTALNRTNGDILWNLRTAIGDWVAPNKSPPNGGATAWSGGSLDPETGALYIPVGNARPQFNATTRQGSNLYANHMMAIDITKGKMLWATPFIAKGTVFDDIKRLPDTHDWDTSWGSNVVKVKLGTGPEKKAVIGHDKMGHVMAMDAGTGEPLWWRTIGTIHRTDAIPTPNGSGEVWPGTHHGIEAYSAADNKTVYVASSSMGFDYFTQGLGGYVVPVFKSIGNGIGNGTITALDITTGKIKWQYLTEFPTKVSPLVTNGIVFSGYHSAVGNPYTADSSGNPEKTQLESTGILLALDKDTGKNIWEFNVGAPIGIGGPSVGNGMLFVSTDRIHPPGEAGAIIAFGLPSTNEK